MVNYCAAGFPQRNGTERRCRAGPPGQGRQELEKADSDVAPPSRISDDSPSVEAPPSANHSLGARFHLRRSRLQLLLTLMMQRGVQSWQGRWGALTSALRPAPPSEIGAPRPAPPSAP